MRIAMWSGPSNLSTALMYSFGARSDCAIWDEPFYAPFLLASGRQDPMREEILATEETDPIKVAARCLGPIPGRKKHFYQKHMPHHMVEGMPREWLFDVTNVFLIRHPARVIVSYAKKRENPTHHDIGFESQAALFYAVTAMNGRPPLVIDSTDIRANPAAMVEKLCAAIGLAYDPAMLSWPAGGSSYDGSWAPHWYGDVWKSTGFAPPEGTLPEVPDHLQSLLDNALPYYEKLAEQAIKL